MKKLSLSKRASGVLLHITSLPGPFGVGDLGPEAYRFAGFLEASGQTWWQMFPIGPTSFSFSPYQSTSAFAGNPLLISLEKLVDQGLLARDDIKLTKPFPQGRAYYSQAARYKELRLQKAFHTFQQSGDAEQSKFEAFCTENEAWLSDYAYFCALKQKHNRLPWNKWPVEWRLHKPALKERVEASLTSVVRYHKFVQYQFFLQWSELKTYCSNKGVGLIGDVPIFVAHDSADVWTHPDLFWLDPEGHPTVVAGVPPDYFSKTGQRWGNPLYRWALLKERGYDWWIDRLRLMFQRFDAVRIDHFIGFQRYWEISAGETTAEKGRWVEGPGADFFEKAYGALGPLELIAEDLGAATDDVFELRDRFGIPGMRVLQFAFGPETEDNLHRPYNHTLRSVVYTGTHDNNTTAGWFKDLKSKAGSKEIQQEVDFILRFVGTSGREIHWDFIRLAMLSHASTAILPVQDLLGLGARARMNTPGTGKGNWLWRLKPGDLTPLLAERLLQMTKTFGRMKRTDK